MGTIPSSRVAMARKAASLRSTELAFSQVGQASLTMTLTDLPFLVLVTVRRAPQRRDLASSLP
jgi:hypothetical protein